jgi:phosphopantetheine adenylyltransferase
MKLALFPGSFKPPHRGHYLLLKKLIDDKSIDKIYIIISPKPRYLIEDNKKSGEVDAETSKKIWEVYLKNIKTDKKVYIMISRIPSPINMAYAIAKRSMKKGDTLILVKSSKDEKNVRFNQFEKDFKKDGVKVRIWSIPEFNALSATNMRKTIYAKDKKDFIKFLPKDLSNKDKNLIWKLLLSLKGNQGSPTVSKIPFTS